MHLRRVTLVLVALLGASYGACTSDENPSVSPDGGTIAGLDASVDAHKPSDSGGTVDVAVDAPHVQPDAANVDASPADAAIADAGKDVAVDAGTDATIDAGTDAGTDAAIALDDAGCPVGTGVLGDTADAGLPSTGLALWLRADLGLVTLDGGAVCRWDDVSGHARAFVPGSSTPPVVDPTGLRGKPGVSFAAAGHHLQRNDVLGLAPTSGRTIAIFARSIDTTNRFEYFYQAAVGSAGTYFGIDTNTFQTAGSRESVYVTNNGYDSNVATSTAARSQVFSISSMAVGTSLPGALVYDVGGTTTTLTRTSGGLGNGTVEDFSAATVTYLGAAGGAFSGAELGEMLVYDRALTAPERTAVEQYFSKRYP